MATGLFTKPILRYASTTKKLDEFFGIEAQRKYFEDYLGSVDLSGGVSGTEAFKTYQQNRFRQLENFISYTDDKGNLVLKGPFWDKLRADDPVPPPVPNPKDAVRQAINTSLKDTKELTDALTEFNTGLAKINAELKKVPPGIDPRTLPTILHVAKAEGKKAIEDHQAHARQELENKLNDATFQTNLKTAMGITDDAQFDKVKGEMLDVLDKSHKAQLDEFEATCNKSITDLQIQIQAEKDRIAYVGAFRDRGTKEQKEALEKLIQAKKDPNLPPVVMGITPDTGNVSIRGVKAEDVPDYTITGRKIEKLEDGTMRIQLPRWYSPWGIKYYNSHHQNPDYDIQSLAQNIRAKGYEKITMEVNHGDPKEADEYGRKMYEACINAGFDPKNIVIKVNGTERKLHKTKEGTEDKEGLFTGFASRLAKTEETAKKLKEEREKLTKEPSQTDMAQYKAKWKALSSPPTPPPVPGGTAPNLNQS